MRGAAAAELVIDPNSLAWLGEDAQSLSSLGVDGRVRLDASDLPGARIVGRWKDGVPLVFRRELARGLIVTVGLPASVERSDFALRPGFLALLDHAVTSAKQRKGPTSSRAGTAWLFPADGAAVVRGPIGSAENAQLTARVSDVSQEQHMSPELTGLYEVEVSGQKEQRVVVLDSQELTQGSGNLSAAVHSKSQTDGDGKVDASPEWALLILALFALELLARTFGSSLLGWAARVRA
jgi:hypothetical protein